MGQIDLSVLCNTDCNDPGADGNFIYTAFASDDEGTGFSLTATQELKYRAELRSEIEIETPAVEDFDGLWIKYIGDDGVNAYEYRAFASAVDGTGFTLTDDGLLAYTAVINSDTEIPSPVVGDFAGLWYKRTGSDGVPGNKAGTIVAFAASTGNADPTNGKIRLNSVVADGTLTILRIDDLDNIGNNIEGVIQRYKAGDILEIKSNSPTGATFLAVRVTGRATDRTGWWDVPIAYASGAIPAVNGEILAIQHIMQGNKAGMPYFYNTDPSGDPGASLFEMNTTTTANVVTLRIDDIDANGVDRSVEIASWKATGHILIEPNSNVGTRFARFLITAIVDSGTYFTITVEYKSGVDFVLNDACVINYIPGSNMTWDGLDILNDVGVPISNPLTYDLLADAHTVGAVALSGKAAIIKKLCDNPGAQPCSIYSDGSKFSILNGKAVLAKAAPNIRISFPAAAWVGTYTFAAGAVDPVGTTRVRSAGGALHGLIQANAIGSTPSHIKIKENSGAGWIPGLYELTIVEDGGDDLTFNHPWDPAFGQPVFGLAGSAFDVYRIRVPRLSADGSVSARSVGKYITPGATAGPRALSFELVALGGASGSGMLLLEADDVNTSNNSATNAVWGFLNYGDASHQYRMFSVADPDGWGANSNSDPAATPGTIATGSAETEILIRVKGLQNEIVAIKNYEIMVTI